VRSYHCEKQGPEIIETSNYWFACTNFIVSDCCNRGDRPDTVGRWEIVQTSGDNAALAGTVALSPDAMFHQNACFATTSGVTDPLTLNSGKSLQSGILEYIVADGFDPSGVATTLFLNSFSANLYVTSNNTDPNAAQITSTEWAAAAAIGEDNPNAGPTGVNSDERILQW
jgi:hypothetical protein